MSLEVKAETMKDKTDSSAPKINLLTTKRTNTGKVTSVRCLCFTTLYFTKTLKHLQYNIRPGTFLVPDG